MLCQSVVLYCSVGRVQVFTTIRGRKCLSEMFRACKIYLSAINKFEIMDRPGGLRIDVVISRKSLLWKDL